MAGSALSVGWLSTRGCAFVVFTFLHGGVINRFATGFHFGFGPSPSIAHKTFWKFPIGAQRWMPQCQSFMTRPLVRPLPVTLSSVDDLVGAGDDDDEKSRGIGSEEMILSIGDLDASEVPANGEIQPSEAFDHEQRLEEIRGQYKIHETDTGSPEFQVAGMTERINYLTQHLRLNPKDFSTRRGLVALVNKRRRLLNFLFRENVDRYKDLVQGLGIRHKAPGRVRSREEKYATFPSQKNPKKHKKT